MEKLIANYKNLILEGLGELKTFEHPKNLYDPVHYLLNLGGKRIRPAVVLMAAELFTDKLQKIVPAAIALEVFHNFTLMHDDIMDNAPLRRGKPTVHEKWNLSTAVLSGDSMVMITNKLFEEVPDQYFKQVMLLFNKTALEVCEGQQFDMDFEQRDYVRHDEYIKMIRLKTSVLLACCFKMGAMLGGATENDQTHLYTFGELLGIAFQLKDDWLDVFGKSDEVGKQIGGDVLANKKTYLLIRAYEKANETQRKALDSWLNNHQAPEEKIKAVTELFNDLGIGQETNLEIDKYYHKAISQLDKLTISEDKKVMLSRFASILMGRTY
ncbi:MAG: geranylgeranyl diphosphate synthase type II [Flavobacteriales bacterium]|jgi:geranylgeranyl diphosphate synthase type II